jgi:hypothetical protein
MGPMAFSFKFPGQMDGLVILHPCLKPGRLGTSLCIFNISSIFRSWFLYITYVLFYYAFVYSYLCVLFVSPRVW